MCHSLVAGSGAQLESGWGQDWSGRPGIFDWPVSKEFGFHPVGNKKPLEVSKGGNVMQSLYHKDHLGHGVGNGLEGSGSQQPYETSCNYSSERGRGIQETLSGRLDII